MGAHSYWRYYFCEACECSHSEPWCWYCGTWLGSGPGEALDATLRAAQAAAGTATRPDSPEPSQDISDARIASLTVGEVTAVTLTATRKISHETKYRRTTIDEETPE